MKKALFIDRDGTIIKEPLSDFQVDSLEKLEFLPKVIRNLYAIRKNSDFEFVMVSNQDGLGTDSFPENTFWPAQNKMLTTLKGEEIIFDEIIIDKTFPHENLPTRKPGTALLEKYIKGAYDLENSFVIGDRLTDVQLAKNIGAKAILLSSEYKDNEIKEQALEAVCQLVTNDWDEVYKHVILPQRSHTIKRTTKETDIEIQLCLDGSGKCEISTGLSFFDHMLEQIGRHSGSDLIIKVKGDLHVDEHHTIEDTGIALGEVFLKALGDKRGIERYGFLLPMDDCLAQVAIDFSGRPWLVWDADFKREKVGDMPTEMFMHFFKSFSDAAKCNLNIKAEGQNEHHKIEAIFKALAKSIKMAKLRNADKMELPSTKGIL